MDYEELFCYVDDFCKGFEPNYRKMLLKTSKKKGQRNRSHKLQLSEIITIILYYQLSGRSCFKYYYLSLDKSLFPNLVHYSRFVKIMSISFPPLTFMLKSLMGEVTEYMFIDATPIAVCHNLRINKVSVLKGASFSYIYL